MYNVLINFLHEPLVGHFDPIEIIYIYFTVVLNQISQFSDFHCFNLHN